MEHAESKKTLRRYRTRDEAALRADWRGKVLRAMAALDQASEPADLDLPGYGFHALTGDMNGRFSITIFRDWRMTFAWNNDGAADLDLEDYADLDLEDYHG